MERKVIVAKYVGRCAICGKSIEPGDEIVRDIMERWVHHTCVQEKTESV